MVESTMVQNDVPESLRLKPKSALFQKTRSSSRRRLYIETSILFRVKEITSPGWMHETSAGAWCTGKTQRDRVEREAGGGNHRDGEYT